MNIEQHGDVIAENPQIFTKIVPRVFHPSSKFQVSTCDCFKAPKKQVSKYQ